MGKQAVLRKYLKISMLKHHMLQRKRKTMILVSTMIVLSLLHIAANALADTNQIASLRRFRTKFDTRLVQDCLLQTRSDTNSDYVDVKSLNFIDLII
jgi:hypothetical protein